MLRALFRRTVCLALGLALSLGAASTAPAQSDQATIGQTAPGFTLKDTDGDTHSLSDYRGKYVVLEWINFECPFVQKHYDSGNMQRLQETYTDKGVVWLSIYTFPPSHSNYYPPEKMKAANKEYGGNQTAILMDPTGKVGRMYGATNTPHMYIINPKGKLIYRGAIDNRPTTDPSDIKGATNYVRQTLTAAMNGKEVSPKRVDPYGCTVKYPSSE